MTTGSDVLYEATSALRFQDTADPTIVINVNVGQVVGVFNDLLTAKGRQVKARGQIRNAINGGFLVPATKVKTRNYVTNGIAPWPSSWDPEGLNPGGIPANLTLHVTTAEATPEGEAEAVLAIPGICLEGPVTSNWVTERLADGHIIAGDGETPAASRPPHGATQIAVTHNNPSGRPWTAADMNSANIGVVATTATPSDSHPLVGHYVTRQPLQFLGNAQPIPPDNTIIVEAQDSPDLYAMSLPWGTRIDAAADWIEGLIDGGILVPAYDEPDEPDVDTPLPSPWSDELREKAADIADRLVARPRLLAAVLENLHDREFPRLASPWIAKSPTYVVRIDPWTAGHLASALLAFPAPGYDAIGPFGHPNHLTRELPSLEAAMERADEQLREVGYMLLD